MPDMTKTELLEFCKAFVDARMSRIQQKIIDIQDALTSETKSSAGDKHETGRAMLQLEREKAGRQLMDAEKLSRVLNMISMKPKPAKVVLGSLVRTDKGNYFIGVSAGKYEREGIVVFCVSANTPVASKMLGKGPGDCFELNGIRQCIKKVS